MSKAITHEIKGIKCDSIKCDYKDMDAEFIPEKWLNAPCPKCGSNLFTEEAFEQHKAFIAMCESINEAFSDVKCDESNRRSIKLTHNGKGLIDGFKISEEIK